MPYIGNSPKNNVRGRFYYTATAAQTVFSGADSNGKTLSYQDGGYVDVYLNGVLLQDTTDYTATTKTSVTLTSGATAGDLVEIIAYGIFSVGDTVSAANGGTFKGNVAINADLTVDTDTLYVDSTNNSVGIGTSSPSSYWANADDLVVSTSGNTGISVVSGTTSLGYLIFADSTAGGDNTRGGLGYDHSTDNMLFRVNNDSKMRIDSSGNLLVGKTTTSSTVDGVTTYSSGAIEIVRTSTPLLYLNRQTSDGDIAIFRKDGSTVGSIGTNASNSLYIAASNQNLGVKLTSDDFRPTNGSGTDSDNVMDLGNSNVRWDDVYATNGTIQTSDRNEKQQIASLTDAEITAAKAISKLFKTFKWNDKVAEKGDAARTHAGVIAQDVQQAMTDAGLNAGNYAFFISSTWWEANETYTDDDGVEQTRTNSYATLEEAPEGATERTRLGIRYPELLAFIGAATEQRLTSIEARLAALETP